MLIDTRQLFVFCIIVTNITHILTKINSAVDFCQEFAQDLLSWFHQKVFRQIKPTQSEPRTQ